MMVGSEPAPSCQNLKLDKEKTNFKLGRVESNVNYKKDCDTPATNSRG